jgi:hypothetical protein
LPTGRGRANMRTDARGNASPLIGRILLDALALIAVLFFLMDALKRLHFGPAVRLSEKAKRRKHRRLAAAAAELGLRYEEGDPAGLLELPFSLLSRGGRRTITRELNGTWRGREAHTATFVYAESTSVNTEPSTRARGVCVTRIDAGFPHVVVEPRVGGSHTGPFPGAAEVPFESGFNGAYRVLSTDPDFARELLDGDVRRWLLADRPGAPWHVEVAEEWLLVSPSPRGIALGAQPVLDTAADLAELVPETLRRGWPRGGVTVEQPPRAAATVPPPARPLRGRALVIRAAVLVVTLAGVFLLNGLLAEQGEADRHGVAPAPGQRPGPDATLVLDGQLGERVEVTVLRVVDPARSTGFSGGPPKGSRVVGVELRLRNIGPDTYEDVPSSGAVLSVDGGPDLKPPLFDDVANAFDVVHLSPGASATGFVGFDVPDGARPTAFRLKLDSGFGPQQGVWAIGG